MLRVILTSLFGFAVAGITSESSGQDSPRPVATVDHVDLERYAGLWHEVARIPNRFQKQCVRGTTAEYSLREDGRVSVVNRCFEEDGSLDDIEGIAKIEDRASNAKLKVSFVSFLGWRLFWGDYWVIGLDEDYQWAVVGTPDRKYGWVLSRAPDVSDDVIEQIFTVIERNGYERAAFAMSQK